jgi:hypothetical protein
MADNTNKEVRAVLKSAHKTLGWAIKEIEKLVPNPEKCWETPGYRALCNAHWAIHEAQSDREYTHNAEKESK